MKKHLNKIIATVSILMLVGFILAYFIPSVAYPILTFGMLIWIGLSGWLYEQRKPILLLGYIIVALVGWILYFTAFIAVELANSWPLLSKLSLFIFMFYTIATSALIIAQSIIFYFDRRKRRKNHILSIPPGEGCSV